MSRGKVKGVVESGELSVFEPGIVTPFPENVFILTKVQSHLFPEHLGLMTGEHHVGGQLMDVVRGEGKLGVQIPD